MEDISFEDAEKCGIISKHSLLDTGEKRYRIICSKDNSSYIRAEGKEVGYWQRGHYHKYARELYIVQNGKIIVAQYIDNKVKINKYKEEDIFIIEPQIPHNIYMYPNAVTHTVKFGNSKEYDWERFEPLDEKIKEMNIKYDD